MKEKLENFTQFIVKFIKKEWKSLLIMLFIGLDVIPFYEARTEHNQDPSVVEYKQLHHLITGSEDNKSIEAMTTTELLQNLNSQSQVYFVKESENKISILAKVEERRYNFYVTYDYE